MNKIWMLLIINVLVLSGCATADFDADGKVIMAEFNKFASWVEKNADYDPYGNTLVIEPQELQDRFDLMIQNINEFTSVKYESISTYKRHCNRYVNDWRCERIRSSIRGTGIGYQWQEGALDRYQNFGYVVSQKNVPKGNVNFGSYSVPINLTVGLTGSSMSGSAWLPYYYHNFTIKKNVNAAAKPVDTASPAKATENGDISERLKKLQQLKEQGLINDAEFNQKKKQLLESL